MHLTSSNLIGNDDAPITDSIQWRFFLSKRILFITTARSDYGPLRPVIFEALNYFNVDLLVGGAHFSLSRGMTINEIIRDSSASDIHLVPLEFMLDGDSPVARAKSVAIGQAGIAQVLSQNNYNAIIIIGDRWELFCASVPALLFGVPVFHISGGEVTEGVIDDSIRHAHTKLAHIHFVANSAYAANVSRMGEEDWRIVISGECGLDSIYNDDIATPSQILQNFSIDLTLPTILVTYHPETLDFDRSVNVQIEEVLDALIKFPDYQIIATMPGMEDGSLHIIDRLKEFANMSPNIKLVNHFGSNNYLGVLKHSKIVVGNSSSGLLEAPSFGVPTVNIGDRQKSRLAASSVIHVSCDSVSIEAGIRKGLGSRHQVESKNCINPYDPYRDGRNAKRIVHGIQSALGTKSRSELLHKKFQINMDKTQWNQLLEGWQ